MDEKSFFPIDQKIAHPHPPRFGEIQLTPAEANYITTAYAYSRQRKLNSQWVVELGILIDKGEMLPESIHFAHCKEDGKIYLVDGYHRLGGQALTDKSFTYPVTHHYCKTLEEVNDVYSKLDQGVPRRFGAAARAHDLSGKLGMPEMYLEAVAAATLVIRHDFRRPQTSERLRSSSERIHLVEEWQEEARLVYHALLDGNTMLVNKLKNSAFLAVMMALARYQPEKARQFIYEVSHNSGKENTGSKAMVTAIINRGHKWAFNVSEQARVMASAWNAFYEDRPLRSAQVQDPTIPIDLLGTPWAGPKLYGSGEKAGRVMLPFQQKIRDIKPKLGVE